MNVPIGRLEIELMANVARLQQDMAQAKNLVGNATRDISAMVGTMKSAFAALGAGLSVGAIVAWSKGVLDAHEEVHKLSQKLGIGVAELSAFKHVAAQSDVSTQALAAGVKKLSQGMTEAADPTSKSAKLLKELGVDTRGSTLPAIEKLADTFQRLPDGPTKAALAVELFGKSGMDLIPMLNQGAEGIRKLKDEAHRLGIVMGEDAAKAAETFNDNLKAISATSQRLGIAIVNDMSEGLIRVSSAMKQAAQDSGILAAAWVALGGAASEAFGLNTTEAERTRRHIRDLQDEILKLRQIEATDLGGGVYDRARMIQAQARIKVLQEELRLVEQLRAAQGGQFDDQASRAARQGRALGGRGSVDEDSLRKILAPAKDVTKAMRELGDANAHVTAEIQHRIKMQELSNKMFDDEFDAIEKVRLAKEGLIGDVRKYAESLELENRLMHLSNAERAKEIALLDLEKAGKSRFDPQVMALADRVRDAVAMNDALRNQITVWNQVGDAAGNFFADLVMNGKSAFDNLKRFAKDLLAQMIALFAKRWVLNMAAGGSLLGSAGSALAGGVGGDSLAGAALNYGGSLLTGGATIAGTWGSAVAGWQGATLGAGLAGPTTAGAGGVMGASSWLAGLGPVGWAALAVVAIAAVATFFRDKGENWRATLGFGDNAQVYRTEGVFGAEGFQQIAGDDALNRQIQAFMVSTGAVDRIIAARLSQTQMDTIRANLGGAYTTRNDGQPAEFAFGRGDDNAGQALTLEYLQKKYGTIFDQIDTTFADFIRSYTGKSEDLFKEIAAFVGMMEGLAGTGIKGFDIAALRAMQHEGETLAQTFERVGGQWATFNDLFTTEAERMTAAQAAINTTFADLGIAVPDSMAAFKDLVNGLDLSTESGRKFFEALMLIAPTFAQVTNAIQAQVANIRSTINSITGNTGPGISSLVDQFQAGNAWSASLSDTSLISALLTITDADLANYSQAHRDLIGSILSAHQAMQNLGASTSSAAAGLSAMGDGFNTTGDKSGLRDWVNRQIFNPATTTLTIDQRFAEAQRQYEDLAKLAKLGNPEAISKLQGAADTYLELARLMFGSSGNYNAIFAQVLSEVGKVGGMSQADVNARLYSALPTTSPIASSADISSLKEAVYDLIMQVANGSDSQAKATREGSRTITEEVRQTANTGRLA